MTLLEHTQQLCKKLGVRPDKKSGQCFLVDAQVLDRLMREAGVTSGDTILEVGGGFGVLTERLTHKAGKVIVVEMDKKLSEYLGVQHLNKVEVVNNDILKMSPEELGLENKGYKVVANLPYQITGKFLKKFVGEIASKPSEMTLMLQKEVAERITAQAGAMSIIAVAVQYYMEVQYLFTVPRTSFYPQPNVDSAVVRLRMKRTLPLNVQEEKKLFQIVRIGFAARRKQLKNNLSAGLHVSVSEADAMVKNVGFSSTIRAQELSVKDWIQLTKSLKLRESKNCNV